MFRPVDLSRIVSGTLFQVDQDDYISLTPIPLQEGTRFVITEISGEDVKAVTADGRAISITKFEVYLHCSMLVRS